jgi:hypothetical protein
MTALLPPNFGDGRPASLLAGLLGINMVIHFGLRCSVLDQTRHKRRIGWCSSSEQPIPSFAAPATHTRSDTRIWFAPSDRCRGPRRRGKSKPMGQASVLVPPKKLEVGTIGGKIDPRLSRGKAGLSRRNFPQVDEAGRENHGFTVANCQGKS